MAPQLTHLQRLQIIALSESGYTIVEIQQRTGHSRQTISFWKRRYEESGNIEGHRRALYQRATTHAQDEDIRRLHLTDPFRPLIDTAASYNVSKKTIYRRLTEGGIKHRQPASKIKLTEAHKDDRICFALQYYSFDWVNNPVIFVDEKTFQSNKDGRKILYRKDRQRYLPQNVLPNRSSGRLSLGYWGWMSSMGPGELVEVTARLTAEQYIRILRDVMVPSVRVRYPRNVYEKIYFVQDNSAVHTSLAVRAWLQTQPDIEVIQWPAKSPDLNPIENLWGQMVLNWDPSEVRTVGNLRDVVNDTWEFLRTRELCNTMVQGMHGRLDAVLDSGGEPLKY